APPPAWIEDAAWIEAALQAPGKASGLAEPYPFEHLFTPVVEQAEALLWAFVDARAAHHLSASARAGLRHLLLAELCELCAPALYERFAKARAGGAPAEAAEPERHGATARYDEFVATMKAGGFRRLFEDKPVLLRLPASVGPEWLEPSREFVRRLDAALASVRRDILARDGESPVVRIEGRLSDPHHGGRSVLILGFEDGARLVYKPKD